MTMTTLDRPDRCVDHQEDPPYRVCRSCVEAARAAGATKPAPARSQPRSRRGAKDPDATRTAIASCSLCDDDGRLPGGQACHHDAAAYAAADRGIAAIRAQLAARQERL